MLKNPLIYKRITWWNLQKDLFLDEFSWGKRTSCQVRMAYQSSRERTDSNGRRTEQLFFQHCCWKRLPVITETEYLDAIQPFDLWSDTTGKNHFIQVGSKINEFKGEFISSKWKSVFHKNLKAVRQIQI